MTALLDLTTVRALVETDLTDPALQLLIDDADAFIIERCGAHSGTLVEYVTPGDDDQYVYTERPIASVVGITETYVATYGETTITLGTLDYAVESDRQLRRKISGNYPRQYWAGMVTVSYTAVDNQPQRKRVLADLVKLAVRYEAALLTLMGDVRVQHVEYAAERERIVAQLKPAGVWFA